MTAPYSLKVYGRRWYLLGHDETEGTFRTYGLDRIQALEKIDIQFRMPADFDARTFFADYVGVITDPDVAVEYVLISIDEDFAPHLRNVPLHPSQREGRIAYPDGSVDVTFQWHIRPTPDFLMELYRYGSSLEVICPPRIRPLALNHISFAK